MAELGTAVEFGTELLSFTQSESEVSIKTVHRTPDGKEEVEQSTASWLIGTDGAHSAVRKTLGLQFLGETIDSIALAFGDFKISGPPREVRDFDQLPHNILMHEFFAKIDLCLTFVAVSGTMGRRENTLVRRFYIFKVLLLQTN